MRRGPATRWIRGAGAAAGVLLLCAAGACERGGGAPDAHDTGGATNATRTPTETYEVRGQVVSVPVEGSPLSELQIRHEHVPDFINFEGENPVSPEGVRGMRAMTMPFPVADASLLEGIAPGDKVVFTMAVDRGSKSYWVSRIETLPAETELDFGVKAP